MIRNVGKKAARTNLRPALRALSKNRGLSTLLLRNSAVQDHCRIVSWLSRRLQSTEVSFDKLSPEEQNILRSERAVDKVDVCIVGGGPAGLATAIRLKQLDNEEGNGQLRVVVLEKGADIGSHIVSGVIMDPRALRELFPESEYYDDKGAGIPLPPDIVTKVVNEEFKFLIGQRWLPVPTPSHMKNEGKTYVGSLSEITAFLGGQAEELGVEVYSGIAVSDVLYSEDGKSVVGVATKDMGISKSGRPKDNFERGMAFKARQVVFAEGCHGSLTKQIIKKFNLRKNAQNQSYGLGLKEVWEVKPEKFRKGFVTHTMGYPLTNSVYGGGFQYHFGENLVTVGLVVGLDYKNPYISPYQEFQKLKLHPYYKHVLEGGKCISYAARALNEGGLQAVPKLNFPGGVLVGASAGFMNVPKIKGSHTAMKSGMLAAEEMFKVISKMPTLEELEEQGIEELTEKPIDLDTYDEAFKQSWIYKELYSVRNVRPSFNSLLGGIAGMAYSGLDTFILKGRVPWTFKFHESDASVTETAANHKPIDYPKPDGTISFDIMTSVSRTGTNHDEDEQCHLRVPDQDLDKHAEAAYPKWKGIENRFCPAGVYEYIKDDSVPLGVKFRINSQNCIHCKTCDIKDPTQDINWTVPEGGDGPKYTLT